MSQYDLHQTVSMVTHGKDGRGGGAIGGGVDIDRLLAAARFCALLNMKFCRAAFTSSAHAQ